MQNDVFTTSATNVSLPELYTIVKDLEKTKLDMVAAPHNLFFKNTTGYLVRENRKPLEMTLSPLALKQVCEKLKVPPQYAERMLAEKPELLDANLNGWLEHEGANDGRNFMLRTYTRNGNNGILRAVLSDKYFDISTYRLLSEVLAVVNEMQEKTGIKIEAQKCDITDQNVFVRFVAPELEQRSNILKMFKDAPNGNQHPGFFTGVVFKNSEVGKGMYSIAPRIITGACQNGAIFADEAVKRMHMGERLDVGEILWSKQTIELEIAGIMSRTRDAFQRWLSPEFLGQYVSLLEKAAETRLSYPIDTVVNLAADLALPKRVTQSVIEYLNGCGMGETVFGVMQSFTGVARDMSPDEKYRIEAAVTDKLITNDPAKFDHKNRAATKFILN